ncbi:hypothetical protein EJB05_18896, partial [Eragrostis curvula]
MDASPTSLQMVIKETLILHPPVPLLVPRHCDEPINILGYDVPQAATVFVSAWAIGSSGRARPQVQKGPIRRVIGRDEKSWHNADEFKPERFKDDTKDFSASDFRFLPGGAGRRMCPGITFGLANIEMVLSSLLSHFDWKLPGDASPHELDMAESYGITVRRKTDLLLEATPFVG